MKHLALGIAVISIALRVNQALACDSFGCIESDIARADREKRATHICKDHPDVERAEYFDPFKMRPSRDADWRKQNVCKFSVDWARKNARSAADLRAVMTENEFMACTERMSFLRRKESTEGAHTTIGTIRDERQKARTLRAFGVKPEEAKTESIGAIVGDFAMGEAVDFGVGKVPYMSYAIKGTSLLKRLIENNCTDQKAKWVPGNLATLIEVGGKFVYTINLVSLSARIEEYPRKRTPVIYETVSYQVKVGERTRVVPIWGSALPVFLRQ